MTGLPGAGGRRLREPLITVAAVLRGPTNHEGTDEPRRDYDELDR
jgi:hypothetical protein